MKLLLVIIFTLIYIFYNFNFNIESFSNINEELIIIIPYRDRKKELVKYILNMKKILNYQNVKFEILVV